MKILITENQYKLLLEQYEGGQILDNLKNYYKNNMEFKEYPKPIPYQKEVEDIQSGLLFLGYSLSNWGIDGKFGPETTQAVIDFQKKEGLEPTGKFSKIELKKFIDTLESKSFSESNLSNIQKVRTDGGIVIENPGVNVQKYPSNLVEQFKNIAGEHYNEFVSGVKSIGLDPIIAIRQLYTESGFSPDVINCSRKSSAGAMGLAQFMPSTWKSYGQGSPCDIGNALNAYIKLMKDLLNQFPGRPDIAVAAYNSGPAKSAYKNALKNELAFTSLKGRIPNETYKYSSTIFQA